MSSLSCDILESVDCGLWNNLVMSVPDGNFYQTTLRADFIKKIYKDDVLFLKIRDGQQLVSLCVLRLNLKQNPLLKLFGCRCNLSIEFGPIILQKERKNEIYDVLLRQIEIIAKRRNIFCAQDIILPYFYEANLAEDNPFVRLDYSFKPWATSLIDLALPENELYANLKGSARNKLRKLEGLNIIVKDLNSEEDLKCFMNIYSETRKRNCVGGFEDYQVVIKWILEHPDYIKIFAATDGKRILSGQGVFMFNKILTEIIVAHSDYAIENKISSGDLVKWEIFKWGNKNKYNIYDLSGIAPVPANKKEVKIREFKEKWGGSFKEYYIYYKSFKPHITKAISVIQKAKSITKVFGRGQNGAA